MHSKPSCHKNIASPCPPFKAHLEFVKISEFLNPEPGGGSASVLSDASTRIFLVSRSKSLLNLQVNRLLLKKNIYFTQDFNRVSKRWCQI